MNDFNGRVAVITGAASGIGMGLAEKAAGEGMKVVLAEISIPSGAGSSPTSRSKPWPKPNAI